MAVTNILTVDELKLKLKDALSKRIVEIIADKSLPYADIRTMASAVVESLPAVQTTQDFSDFLEELLSEYPFLKNEIIFMRNEVGHLKESKVMEKLRSYISNYNSKT